MSDLRQHSGVSQGQLVASVRQPHDGIVYYAPLLGPVRPLVRLETLGRDLAPRLRALPSSFFEPVGVRALVDLMMAGSWALQGRRRPPHDRLRALHRLDGVIGLVVAVAREGAELVSQAHQGLLLVRALRGLHGLHDLHCLLEI